MNDKDKKWQVSIRYRHDTHTSVVTEKIEELDEVYDIVESGHHFDTVISINISRINHVDDRLLTVEQAEKL